MTGPVFDRIAIIGMGLIGGSIAHAAREYHAADIIVGCDTNPDRLHMARAQKIIDIATPDPAIAVAQCQLVILAVPPLAMESVARCIAPSLLQGTMVMDTASVKRHAMYAVAPHLPDDIRFVPAHPIAGSEQAGLTQARHDLFMKKRIIISPGEPLEPEVLQKVNAFWSALGARVDAMPPDTHDHVYAHVSHLPQLLAFACGAMGIGKNDASLLNFTRLQSSSRQLWSEIFTLNAAYLAGALSRYLDVTAHIAQELSHPPENEQEQIPSAPLSHRLFARVAASCLITTVMEAEKNAGMMFARFAGSGMMDFTSPAAQPPEADIETISSHSRAVAALLREYTSVLSSWHNVIADGDSESIFRILNAGN